MTLNKAKKIIYFNYLYPCWHLRSFTFRQLSVFASLSSCSGILLRFKFLLPFFLIPHSRIPFAATIFYFSDLYIAPPPPLFHSVLCIAASVYPTIACLLSPPHLLILLVCMGHGISLPIIGVTWTGTLVNWVAQRACEFTSASVPSEAPLKASRRALAVMWIWRLQPEQTTCSSLQANPALNQATSRRFRGLCTSTYGLTFLVISNSV